MKILLTTICACLFAGAVLAQPTISSFSPASGAVGTTVTISGAGFDALILSNNVVYFGAARASVTGATAGSLTVTVPSGATYAPITVTKGGFTAYSQTSFLVTFGALPVIDETIFAPATNYSVSPSSGPENVTLGDIDGDGKPDLVVANTGSGTIRIMRNTSTPGGLTSSSFDSPGLSYPAGTAPYGLALGDLDGDGDLDIVASDTAGGKIYIWQNGSTVASIDSASMFSLTVGTRPFGIGINDLDLDGRPDIVIANKGNDNVSVLLQNGGNLLFSRTDYSTGVGSNPVEVVVHSDVDGDDFPDIATVNSGNSTSSVLINDFFGSVSGTFSFPLGSGASSIALLDFDGDGKPDIVSANSIGNSVSLLKNTSLTLGTPAFAAKVDIGAGSTPCKVSLADIDGDGKPDVVVTNRTVDSLSVLRNTATGGAFSTATLAPAVRFATGDSPCGLTSGDIDSDGKPELVVVSRAGNSVDVFRNKAIRVVTEMGNDTSATTLLNIGETVQSVIESAPDVDYYRFVLNPGDTVSIDAREANGSGLTIRYEIRDSVGNWYSGNEIVDNSHVWYVFAPSVTSRTYLLRIRSAYNATSFPSSTQEHEGPVIVPGSATAADSGSYRLSLERFVPSPPRVYYYAGVYNVQYNRARWWAEFYPNGLPTNVGIELSTSSNFSSSLVVQAGQSPGLGIYRLYFDSSLPGLQPNTSYYYRVIASNSAGVETTQVSQFSTPPAPVGWIHQFSGVANEVTGISYGSDTTGVVVGYGGMIRRTTNGGATWIARDSAAGVGNLYGVWMLSPTIGYGVGSGETVAKTTDGGAKWYVQTTTGTDNDLWRVKFVTSVAGIAVGRSGLIIRWANTGTWLQERFTGGYMLYGVDYADLNTVVAVGEGGTILRSIDKGDNWDSIPSPTTNNLRAVDFVSSTTGFIVGWNVILKTTDGGVTWNQVNVPNLPLLYDVSFKDASNGIVVGGSGLILRTSDGGASWQKQVTGTYSELSSSTFRGRSLAAGGPGGLILSSLDPKVESEPNDDLATAIGVNFRDDVDAAIQPIGDVDYYRIDLAADDTIAVTVVTRDTVYVNGLLELLDSGGTPISGASNDDFISGDTTQSRVFFIAPAGTYYARYSAVAGGTGNYRLRFRRASPQPLIPFGGTASIVTTSDVTISAPVISNNVSTDISFEYGETTAYGTTVPANVTPVAGQELTTATAMLTALSPFTQYHFRVKAQNAYGTTYGSDVAFETVLGTARTELEANNSSGEANTVFIGDTLDGVISASSDVDYYRFQAAAGDTLEVYAYPTGSSEAYLRVEVIDSTNQNAIVSNNWMPNPQDIHSVFRIYNTGVYFLRITYSYYYNTYYPNERDDRGMPLPAIAPASTASVDTGSYRIRLARFTPSLPGVQDQTGLASLFSDYAIQSGAISPNGLPTTVSVEYGTSASYGQTAIAQGPPLQGIETREVRIPISGLLGNTTYHFRVKAENSAGFSYSNEDITFTTPPSSDGWIRLESGVQNEINGVDIVSDSVVLAAAGGNIVRTTNGGASWSSPSNPGAWIYTTAFANKDTGLAAGWGVIGTTNGGATWNYLGNVPDSYFQDVEFAGPSVAIGVGGTYNSSIGNYEASVFRTTDAGLTWSIIKRSQVYRFNAIEILNADTAFVAGADGWVFRTYDLSAPNPIWDSVSIGSNTWINDIAVIDPENFTLALDKYSNTNQLLSTANGGALWTPISLPQHTNFRFIRMNGSRGITGGNQGAIFRTTNSGVSWFKQESGTSNVLYAAAYEGRYIYVGGVASTLMKYADPIAETEPNDAIASANPSAIGDQVDGMIAAPGDLDVFSFDAVAGDTLEALLLPGSDPSVNGKLEFLGTDGTPIVGASNDDLLQGDTTKARVVHAFTAPGLYFVRVSGSSGSSAGSYNLRLSRTSLIPQLTAMTVSVTPSSATMTGFVDPNNLLTTVQVEYGQTTSYGTMVPFNESPIAASQQRKAISKTLTSLTENTQYNYRILASNAAGSFVSQNMTFNTPRAEAITEVEPNDSAYLALEIAFGDSIDGSISPLNDVDYFKMHVSASDTLEMFSTRRGFSQLRGKIQLIDSAGQYYYDNNDWFPTDSTMHSVTGFSGPTTLYIRYNYASNYSTSFPGSRDEEGILPIPLRSPSGTLQTASDDTGAYRLYVRRFVRSAPEGQSYIGYGSIYHDAVALQTTIASNGLPTTVNFEYGASPQSYGNPVSALDQPFNDIYRNSAFSPLITGLQANTTYYVRSVLTNSAGTTYGGGNTIATPPAPDGWTRFAGGTGPALWDVEFPTDLVGFAVGGGGMIRKTTDGGATWTGLASGVSQQLRGVSFASQSVGMAVGGTVVLKTTDGGVNWVQQTTGATAALFSVKMLSATEAVAVGYNGTIVRTTNSGSAWDTVRTGTEYLRSLSFSPAGDTGYAVGYNNNGESVILKTADRGASWQSINTLTGSYYAHAAWFHNGRRGVVTTSNRSFYHTEDGGATWTQSTPASGGYYVYALSFADTSNGVAAGDNGAIYRTYNGGRSWSFQNSGTYNVLLGATLRGRSAHVVGDYGTILNAVGLLAAPTSLTATFAGVVDSVALSWNDLSANETGYLVERKTGSGGEYALVHTTPGNSTGWSDAVTRGAIYYYKVRAYVAGTDTSTYSNEDSAFVPLHTPTALNATTVGSTRIDLSWSANPDARDGFKVERATSAGGSFSEIGTPAAGATSYSDLSAASGTKYYYRIRSFNAAMQSEYSNVDSALTALGKPQSLAANPSVVTNGPITISWAGPSGAAKAMYNIDSPPGVSLTIEASLTGNSFVLANPPTGARWVFVALQNTEGVTDFGVYDSVLTRFDDVDPVITDQSVLPTVEVSGTSVTNPASITIQAQVTKPSGIANLLIPQLEYKKTNSDAVTTVPFTGLEGGTINLSSLNSLFLTIGKPNGLEYRITAADAAGNTAATVWKSFTVFVTTPPVSDFVPPAAGTGDDITTLVANYRLFSVPYDLSDKKPGSFMETVDKGLGPHSKDGVNYYNWRMQRYVNSTYQDYEDFKTQDVLTPGSAFFILSREQKSITVGSGNLVKASDMYSNGIQVLAGWNLVGNPFPDDFPADSMFVLSGSIANRAYYDGTGPDGGWYKTGPQINTLKKWEGLAVNVTQNTSLRFKAVPQTGKEELPPVAMAASARKVIEEKKEGGWLLQIDAHRSGSAVVDVGNMIGEAPDAHEGYDSFDSFQPPLLPGKSLTLYFNNPDGAMSSDIRPIQTNGSSWEMKVITGDRGARVKVDVSKVVPIPDATLEAYLLDIEDHMAHDLKEKENVEFGSKEGIRNFRIVVGSKGYVDSVSASLGIDLVPQVFVLYQNYPNPFNPETALRFWLPGNAPSYRVSLKVYNIIGQEVATVINRDMRPGYYETTFNGRNLASGTYIYRLTVDGGTKEASFSSVKKMVMVK